MMKKILIHSEEIKKAGAKLQFQIKLPTNVFGVKGILTTVVQNGTVNRAIPPIENEDPPQEEPPIIPEVERGWLWLRIPEERDVFYADTVRFAEHTCKSYQGQDPVGLGSQKEWWFSGRKKEFFRISVPLKDSIIEGYYVDVSPEDEIGYTLQIYLELEAEENPCKLNRKEQDCND